MKVSLFVLLSFFGLAWSGPVENETASEYILNFKNLALSEMMRTGIPASIKLGQAMLESNMGRSELANYANNHFGIKCGKSWSGSEYFREDDDYYKGKKIKSCFRKYNDPVQSFIAHSDFLSDNGRYEFLFDLDQKDYKAWAHGLKKAGYATDKNYAIKLINLIEKFELYQLDSNEEFFVSDRNTDEVAVEETAIVDDVVFAERASVSTYAVSETNRTRFIQSSGNETLRQIASEQGVDVKDLKKYNNEYSGSSSSRINRGTRIYLEEKKYNYSGTEEYHIVGQGETMEDISNRYGVKLETLYLKNKMPRAAQPFPGEKVFLKGLIHLKNTPKYFKKGDKKSNTKARLF